MLTLRLKIEPIGFAVRGPTMLVVTPVLAALATTIGTMSDASAEFPGVSDVALATFLNFLVPVIELAALAVIESGLLDPVVRSPTSQVTRWPAAMQPSGSGSTGLRPTGRSSMTFTPQAFVGP
jgi:hypothetical protein